jgi:hypothetical protein
MKQSLIIGVLALSTLSGCTEGAASQKEPAVPVKKSKLGKGVYLEVQGEQRRVVVEAYVCLREGALEQFLTRKGTKEHEAILAADVDAREIHVALIAAGAEEGKPVQFQPKYKPATGSVIKINVAYEDNGKQVEVPARTWIRDHKGKDLDHDWVFGGSMLFNDPLDKDKKPFYAANDGDVICVSNFDTAMLDLPIQSSQSGDELVYEAHTQRIPKLGTPVLVILEPVLKKKQ